MVRLISLCIMSLTLCVGASNAAKAAGTFDQTVKSLPNLAMQNSPCHADIEEYLRLKSDIEEYLKLESIQRADPQPQFDPEKEAMRLRLIQLIQEGEDLKRAEERSKKSHSWFKWVVLGYFFYIVSAIRDKEARIGKKNMELAEKFGIYKPGSVEIAIDSLYIIVVIVAVVSLGIIASALQDDFEKALSTPSSMLIGLGAYLLGNWITCISAGGSKARITFSVFCGTVFCGALITAFVVDVGSKETVLPGLLEWALMLLLIPSLLLWTPKASEWFKQMKIRRELSRAESGNDDSGVVNDEKRQP